MVKCAADIQDDIIPCGSELARNGSVSVNINVG